MKFAQTNKQIDTKGGSPCQVIMDGDSCSEGHYCILDGHFSYIFYVKIVMFL